jgi:hypothetical protein
VGNPLRLPPQARTEKGRLTSVAEGSRGKGGTSKGSTIDGRHFTKQLSVLRVRNRFFEIDNALAGRMTKKRVFQDDPILDKSLSEPVARSARLYPERREERRA